MKRLRRVVVLFLMVEIARRTHQGDWSAAQVGVVVAFLILLNVFMLWFDTPSPE